MVNSPKFRIHQKIQIIYFDKIFIYNVKLLPPCIAELVIIRSLETKMIGHDCADFFSCRCWCEIILCFNTKLTLPVTFICLKICF